jgi:uncharacterized membrane protein SirB2
MHYRQLRYLSKQHLANSMSLESLRQQSWLRTAIAVLVLCFALGTIAHAGHQHEQNNARTHLVCDYCTSFGTLVDAPLQTVVADTVQLLAGVVTFPIVGFIATRPVGVAQARAPPVLN